MDPKMIINFIYKLLIQFWIRKTFFILWIKTVRVISLRIETEHSQPLKVKFSARSQNKSFWEITPETMS